MYRSAAQKLIALVMLLMALGVALRPNATIGVMNYLYTAMGINVQLFAILLLAGAAVMILLVPRAKIWWRPALEALAVAPFWLYAGATILYVAFNDVNLAPAAAYTALCIMVFLAGVGNGRID